MPSRSQRTGEIVIARSKRTGERYPARTSHLVRHSGSHSPYLHYTDSTRLDVCRCSTPHEHGKPRSVSEYDGNLAMAMTRYMDKLGLKECHQPAFHRYREQQRIQWALNSVHAEHFHYISKDKGVVCRCNENNHHFYRRLHNPDIQELCAEFFLSETMQTVCTRDQWRAMDETTAKSVSWIKPHADSSQPRSRELTPSKGSFEYDNASVVELLQRCETRSSRSHKHHSRSSSHQRARPSSRDQKDVAHLSNSIEVELDILEDVWRVSRPSVYLGQDNFESHVSTPIGSSATPVQPHRQKMPKVQMFRPETPEIGATAPRVDQYADTWPEVVSHPGISKVDDKFSYFDPCASSHPRDGDDFRISELDGAGRDMRFSEKPWSSATEYMPASAPPTHIAELPSLDHAIQLDATPVQRSYLSHHSPTLRELEGGSFVHNSKLAGRNATKNAR